MFNQVNGIVEGEDVTVRRNFCMKGNQHTSRTVIVHNQIVDAAFKGIRPIVVALMFAPALGFARSISGVATAVAAAVALMIWYAGITPILLLLAGAIIGLLLAARRGKEVKR